MVNPYVCETLLMVKGNDISKTHGEWSIKVVRDGSSGALLSPLSKTVIY